MAAGTGAGASDKRCPLLRATCQGEKCAWWFAPDNNCSIVASAAWAKAEFNIRAEERRKNTFTPGGLVE